MRCKPVSHSALHRPQRGKRTDQTRADSGQTRSQAASRHRPPPLATGPSSHQSAPTIDQQQARRRPAQIATLPATAGSDPDVTYPTPRTCTAQLPCPHLPVTSVSTRVLSPPVRSHLVVTTEKPVNRSASEQDQLSAPGSSGRGALSGRPRESRRTQMVMLKPEEKREHRRQQKTRRYQR
ncbi:hypothetical protein PVE_P0375 (plasmid) [Pseudomonas veronii 1YdBTEX2]|uniref:Uncharacterized protein n=1 Tax=Pseudomonas veronii 1YdBTEX2 TaxID=1295141 RepID=A0A1D3KAV9_PSEVE|nr:hypothetical protein PVE_P0375 [Pseudomonas veronii 1YdBTEX2]